MVGARLARWMLAGTAAVLLTACAQAAGQDRPLTITLSNGGSENVQCRLMFGHWVDRDLGIIAPGASTVVEVTQAVADGALYVLRDDGARKMMIETLDCGREGDWTATRGQADLAPLRAAPVRRAHANCGIEPGQDQVTCRVERIET